MEQPETCLAEDDHQLQNPRSASSEIGVTCVAEDGHCERKWKEEWPPRNGERRSSSVTGNGQWWSGVSENTAETTGG